MGTGMETIPVVQSPPKVQKSPTPLAVPAKSESPKFPIKPSPSSTLVQSTIPNMFAAAAVTTTPPSEVLSKELPKPSIVEKKLVNGGIKVEKEKKEGGGMRFKFVRRADG